jgi:predicted nucleic acid-binding protein
MSDVVVDSRVVAKWFVPEPDSAQAEQVVTDVKAAGGRLIVLDLVYSEVANVIWKNYRVKPLPIRLQKGRWLRSCRPRCTRSRPRHSWIPR